MAVLPDLLTIPQVAAYLGSKSRGPVYELIHAGKLRTTDIGSVSRSRTRVYADSLYEFVESRASKPKRKGRTA